MSDPEIEIIYSDTEDNNNQTVNNNNANQATNNNQAINNNNNIDPLIDKIFNENIEAELFEDKEFINFVCNGK